MFNRVRTRFAPSPTGHLHLGGARTALYCYLFAQHYKGKFVVRFEDTDRQRHQSQIESKLLSQLRWLGLQIDESVDIGGPYEPYRQSDRLPIYQKIARQLVQTKKAYYCFCTREELAKEKKQQLLSGQKAPQYSKKCLQLKASKIQEKLKNKISYCIRLEVQPEQKIIFNDLVYGEVFFETTYIEDFILIKTDLFPTYNFAVIVDDHLMEISHILRGSDHLSNTPKQILLYQALEWNIPTFAHLTLLKTLDTAKMSKRLFISKHYLDYYAKNGYLPQALANYLALLGWCPDLNREIFSLSELISRFNGRDLNKAASTFDWGKLNWVNQQHLRKLEFSTFLVEAKKYTHEFQQKYQISDAKLIQMITSARGAIRYFGETSRVLSFYTEHQIDYSQELLILLKTQKKILTCCYEIFSQLTLWNEQTLFESFFQIAHKTETSQKKLSRLLERALVGHKSRIRLKYLLLFKGQKAILYILNSLLKRI